MFDQRFGATEPLPFLDRLVVLVHERSSDIVAIAVSPVGDVIEQKPREACIASGFRIPVLRGFRHIYMLTELPRGKFSADASTCPNTSSR